MRGRTTSDLLVLLIAGTVCLSVFVSVIVTAGLAFFHPDKEHPGALSLVTDSLQMLMSLLAGFLAGRSEANVRRMRRERDEEADE